MAEAAVYLEEEDVLGIDAFVNELELLLANGKQLGRVDQAQLLELLPKIAATTSKTSDRTTLKAMQKRCEPAFTELISIGVSPTVRRLICVCLTRFYTHADMLSIYARVSMLQTTLSGKEVTAATKTISDPVRVCMLEVLAYLALHHGRYLSSAAAESLSIASKSVSKGTAAVRVAGLRLAACTIEGMNSADRVAPQVQVEGLAMFSKAAKERQCPDTRAAAAQLMSGIARAGGAALWRDAGWYWEDAIRVCCNNIADPAQAVRDAYGLALCDLAVAVRSDALGIAIRDEQRPARKTALEKLRADSGALACKAALQQPLVEAALQNKADVCASLALAWTAYIGYAASHGASNANIMVELAMQVVGLCDTAARSLAEAKAQGLVQDTTLGGALAGGEIPHLQACVLYILRTAVIESLSESGQRLLVQRLAGLLQRPGCPVPTAVVALEGLSILLSVLGEIADESGAAGVQLAITTQIVSSSTPVRQMASQAAAALAAAQPAQAAALLASQLEQLAAATQLLGGVKPGTAAGPTTSAYDALLGKAQHVLMATAHGTALAVASVLMVACQLPLSVPTSLPREAYRIAVHLIMEPHSENIAARALEREAGYIVIGALISCWSARSLSVSATIPPQGAAATLLRGPKTTSRTSRAGSGSDAASVASGSSAAMLQYAREVVEAAGDGDGEGLLTEVLGCLALALGPGARRDLDENLYTHPGGDAELAMELWWRSVALQALHAYMAHILPSGLITDAATQVFLVADLLAPVMAVVDAQVCISDPQKAKGGPAGLLAACSATFQLRLLECVQLLDLTRLQPPSQAVLLKLCSKPIKAASIAAGGLAQLSAQGMSPVAIATAAGYNPGLQAIVHAAINGLSLDHISMLLLQLSLVSAALHRTALRYCLAKEDAALGPWPLGRDTAEDELHDFAGERGAPHKQPWEPPLLASLFGNVDPTSNSNDGGAASLSLSATGPQHAAALAAAASGAGGLVTGDRARGALYPQPIGLGTALLAAQAAALGRLLGAMPQATQLQILDELIAAASAGKNKKPVPGDKDAPARRHAACALVAVAALSGLMPAAARKKAPGESADKMADKVLQLANALLDGGGAAELGIARAGAQLMAASALIGTDIWAVKVVQAIVEEVGRSVVEGRDPERRAALCLALGCIHRAMGGLALQAVVPASVGALLTAVKRPVAHTALWALHALTLCASSAGGAYMQHVRATLQLCQDLLVSTKHEMQQVSEASLQFQQASAYDSPGLRPACARLANVMVGVLGPEFALGGLSYKMAKSLTTDMVQVGVLLVDDHTAMAALCMPKAEVGGSGRLGSSSSPLGLPFAGPTGSSPVSGDGGLSVAPRPITFEALACELQAVLFAQQAILFAPKAVQAGKHVPMLQATLLSRRPALRKAAAATLYHLSERDPGLLLPAHIEGPLFAALDDEANASIAAHLRATLLTLMSHGARQQPGYWLSCLSQVVFSSAGSGGTTQATTEGGAGAPTRAEEEDEEQGEEEAGGVAARSRAAAAGSMAGSQGKAAAATSRALGKTTSQIGAAHASTGGGLPSASSTGALQALLATVALRLRTRLFAASMLLAVVQQASKVHKERGVEGTKAGQDVEQHREQLVEYLQELVDIGFKLSTGSMEALRPAGVQLLDTILRHYAAVEDPLMPGARLLEQYQAQFVSALRAALGPTAGPQLAIAGGSLATTFLESGMASGDSQVMKRLMELLIGPLSAWFSQQQQQQPATQHAGSQDGAYAEWVDVHQRIALLRAHAQCAILAKQGGDELTASIVAKAHRPYRLLLTTLWSALLQDHAVVSSQHPLVRQQYQAALLQLSAAIPASDSERPAASQPPAAAFMTNHMVDAVRDVYASACPVVLEAVTAYLPTANELLTARGDTDVDNTEAETDNVVAPKPGASVGDSETSSLWARYCNLLDVSLMLIMDTSASLVTAVKQLMSFAAIHSPGSNGVQVRATQDSLGSAVGGAASLASSLGPYIQGMHRLLAADHVSHGLASTSIIVDVLHALTALAHQALLPMSWLASHAAQPQLAALGTHAATLAAAVADCVKEVCQGINTAQFTYSGAVQSNGGAKHSSGRGTAGGGVHSEVAAESALAASLLECILATSSITTPFVVLDEQGSASHLRKASSSVGLQLGGPTYAPAPESLVSQSALKARQAVRDNALVALLVSSTLLLRKLPPDVLSQCIGPMLQLCGRVLVTAPPGMQLQATHRFLGTLLGSCITLCSSVHEDNGQNQEQVQHLVDEACLTVAGVVQHAADHLQALQALVSAVTASVSTDKASELVEAVEQLCGDGPTARTAACLMAAATSVWHLPTQAPSSSVTLPPDAVQLCSAVRQLVLDVLRCAVHPAPSSSAEVMAPAQQELLAAAQGGVARWQRSAFEAIRTAAQEGSTSSSMHTAEGQAVWAREVLQALGPAVAVTTHELLTQPVAYYSALAAAAAAAAEADASEGGQLSVEVGQVASEGLRALLAGATLALTQGDTEAQAVLSIVVPLLVEAAAPSLEAGAALRPAGAPSGSTGPHDVALALVTSLPASPLGSAFKSVVASLPTASKARLQAALTALQQPQLQTSTGGAAPGATGGSAGGARPTIQLKTSFTVPH